MSFLAWLKLQQKRHDLIGDLARDSFADSERPCPAHELHHWWAYLERCGACEGAYRALRQAWREYRCQYRPKRKQVRSVTIRISLSMRPSLRFRILKRDGYRCQICGATAQDGVKLEVDHKVPRAKGGPTVIENLWALCFPCNRGKRDETL